MADANSPSRTVLGHTTSGGTTLNDSFSHASFSNVSFGGVGESGMGSYRGKASFDCFTHQRVVADVPSWMEPFLRVRYMPYKWGELKRFRLLTSDSPDFDREGRVIKGLGYWLKFVLTLGASGTGGGGGSGAKGAFLRWCVVLLAAGYAGVQYRGLTLSSFRRPW